jgi:hypothetical protein
MRLEKMSYQKILVHDQSIGNRDHTWSTFSKGKELENFQLREEGINILGH